MQVNVFYDVLGYKEGTLDAEIEAGIARFVCRTLHVEEGKFEGRRNAVLTLAGSTINTFEEDDVPGYLSRGIICQFEVESPHSGSQILVEYEVIIRTPCPPLIGR